MVMFRLCGDFLERITELLPGLQFLDLQRCPDIETCLLRELVSKNPNLQIKVGPGCDPDIETSCLHQGVSL
jgi:hypothetical protein